VELGDAFVCYGMVLLCSAQHWPIHLHSSTLMSLLQFKDAQESLISFGPIYELLLMPLGGGRATYHKRPPILWFDTELSRLFEYFTSLSTFYQHPRFIVCLLSYVDLQDISFVILSLVVRSIGPTPAPSTRVVPLWITEFRRKEHLTLVSQFFSPCLPFRHIYSLLLRKNKSPIDQLVVFLVLDLFALILFIIILFSPNCSHSCLLNHTQLLFR
jgi:hypothetical protein